MNTDTDLHSPEYLGITEAADYLRVSASTLRRWEKKGFLVPERTPTGIRRYTKKQLDDVIQAPVEHQEPHEASSPNTIDSTIAYPTGIETVNLNDIQPDTNEVSPQESNISLAEDDEVNQIRDFFKKAGYSTPPQDESVLPLAATPSEEVSPILAHEIPDSQINTNSSYGELLSIHDITHDFATAKDSRTTEPLEMVKTVEPKTNSPSIQVEPVSTIHQEERIEVFHEENSDINKAPTNNYSQQEEITEPDHENPSTVAQTTSYHHSAEPGKSKSAYVAIGIVIAILFISFIGWAVYSYYVAPVELFSPVIQ